MATETDLVAERPLNPPVDRESFSVKLNRKLIGAQFKDKSNAICNHFNRLKEDKLKELYDDRLRSNDIKPMSVKIDDALNVVDVTREMLQVVKVLKRVESEEYVPSVIEPSFGIGRVLYCIWEHNIRVRVDDCQRIYFTFPDLLAPYICTVLPLSGQDKLIEMCEQVSSMLSRDSINHRVERSSSASIGKRYARCDEIGIPYAVTVDFDSLKNGDCTVRQRNSMQQIRISVQNVTNVLKDLTNGHVSWFELFSKHKFN